MFDTLSLRRRAKLSGRGKFPTLNSGSQSSPGRGVGAAAFSSCSASSASRAAVANWLLSMIWTSSVNLASAAP